MGELHLDIIVDRMKREFKVEANVGAPQVAYRETIENSSEVEYTHKKQSGGAGQFAKVKLLVEPQEPGKGRAVESKIKGGAIPKEFIPGVEKGIETVKPKVSSDKAAASSIKSRKRAAVEADETNSYLTESAVAKMSLKEYEKRAEEILEAQKSGKFIYDLSR